MQTGVYRDHHRTRGCGDSRVLLAIASEGC